MPHRRIFLTMCTFARRRLFAAHPTAEAARSELLHIAGHNNVEVVAYTFMPDHLHALISGTSDCTDAKRFFTAFRQRTGFRHRRSFRQRLWQDGYFDRHLRDEESTFEVVSYILANPVQAGLCESPQEYRFSGSNRYELNEVLDSVQWKPSSLGRSLALLEPALG